MGYFADIFRDRDVAQRQAAVEFEAAWQTGNTVRQLRAAARHLIAMDDGSASCDLLDRVMAQAKAAAVEHPREYFDVAVAALIAASARVTCRSLLTAEDLLALAKQLGDPARMYFVLEARIPTAYFSGRRNDEIATSAAQLDYAISNFQVAYSLANRCRTELEIHPDSDTGRRLCEQALEKITLESFPTLGLHIHAFLFRADVRLGNKASAFKHMQAVLPGVLKGRPGARDSTFYLISFARLLLHMGRTSDALSMIDRSRRFPSDDPTIKIFRSRMLLEIYTAIGTPDAYARALPEVGNVEALLRQPGNGASQTRKGNKQVISKFYERFGQYQAALSALKDANQAAEEVQRLAGETARIELQEKLHVAAKDKENTQLKAEAELQAERQRGWVVAFGIALLGGALAAVALGMAVRRGRRLASVSAELAQRNGELEQRSASRIRLLAAACHDLRQPAHALGMLAELGDDARRDPSRFGAWLQSVRRSTASLSDMLDALMDLGRLDNGQYTPHTGPVSLAELLHEVTLHFSGLAQRKGLTLHVTPAEGEVVSDRHLLRRIVFNLVSNAIKYTDTGHVRVSLERGSHTVLLNVQDSGPGIPPDKLEEVFRDHVRLNPTKAAEGLGIGLSIVRRAAELLGHPLSLVSPPGQGTTATLQLPLAADGAARLVAQAAPRADAPQGCVIGLLEDDADVREATAALLRRWGYTVYAAADAAALKDSLDPTRPPLSLLLSDLHLGSLNGLDELTQLRGALQAPTLPALLVTGDMDAAVAIQAARAGVYVAHKPLAPGRLGEIVQDLVRAASHAEPQAVAQGVT